MSTETQRVDVLAVLELARGVLSHVDQNDTFFFGKDKLSTNEAWERFSEARVAVAELIDAAREVEVDAASLGMTTKRLSAAIDRVGGAA